MLVLEFMEKAKMLNVLIVWIIVHEDFEIHDLFFLFGMSISLI